MNEIWLKYHIFDFINELSGSLIESEKYAEWKTVLLGIYHGILCHHPLGHFFPTKEDPKSDLEAVLSLEKSLAKSTSRHSKFEGSYSMIVAVC